MYEARTVLRQIVGNVIPVVPHESGKNLIARIGLDVQELCEIVGSSQKFVVAGAFCLLRTGCR